MNNDKMQEVIKFLLGEGELEGRWFGDEPPKRKPFWWRTHLRAALSTHGQESEAQAIGYITPDFEKIMELRGVTLMSKEASDLHELPVFLAPPSALAIETAAKRQAAECCKPWMEPYHIAEAILATIPQDGITELERLLAECRKQTLLEAAEKFEFSVRAELRRMAEGDEK